LVNTYIAVLTGNERGNVSNHKIMPILVYCQLFFIGDSVRKGKGRFHSVTR